MLISSVPNDHLSHCKAHNFDMVPFYLSQVKHTACWYEKNCYGLLRPWASEEKVKQKKWQNFSWINTIGRGFKSKTSPNCVDSAQTQSRFLASPFWPDGTASFLHLLTLGLLKLPNWHLLTASPFQSCPSGTMTDPPRARPRARTRTRTWPRWPCTPTPSAAATTRDHTYMTFWIFWHPPFTFATGSQNEIHPTSPYFICFFGNPSPTVHLNLR